MTRSNAQNRPNRRSARKLVVFSELNHDLQPTQLAKIIVAAGLEQARLEKEAREKTTPETDEVPREN